MAPSDLKKIENVFVLIVMGNPLPIMEQMKREGIEYMHISELHFSYYEKGSDVGWLRDCRSQITEALQCLSDDKSREIFTKVFLNKIYLSRTEHEYLSFYEEGEYFQNGLWELDSEESLWTVEPISVIRLMISSCRQIIVFVQSILLNMKREILFS